MKKLLILTLCLGGFLFANASEDRPIQFTQLPQKAQTFIKKHFSTDTVSFSTIDEEFMDKSYEVVFQNGNKVDFNGNGEWKDIDCKRSAVPPTILPKAIYSYVQKNFHQAIITDVEKKRNTYDIELNNGIELVFNLKGSFVRMDH